MKKILWFLLLLVFLIVAVLAGLHFRGAFSFGQFSHAGQLLYWVNATPFIGGVYAGSADGSEPAKKIMFNPFSPDAVAIDKKNKQIYMTNMNLLDDSNGNIMRADFNGGELTNITLVVPDGMGVRTPKQLVLDETQRKVYFSDREGRRVYRAPMDGVKANADLEILVDFTALPESEHQFVGIAIDEQTQQFYWTDRFTNTIWRASSELDHVITPDTISVDATQILTYDEGMLLEIDIDFDNNHLYFTDRGEGNELFGETLPAGFVGKVDLNNLEAGFEVIVPDLLKDPVGLSVSSETGYLYYSTSEDCKLFRKPLAGGNSEQIHEGRAMCEGMKFVSW